MRPPTPALPDDAAAARAVAPTLEHIATHTAEVGGIPVRRAIPTRVRRMVGAWCFLDHLGPSEPQHGQALSVGQHPHIGLQTFTWMLEGEILHRDSLGTEQVIRPGQVNLMTAGRGICHTEESLGDTPIHTAQLWIALPDSQRHCAPAFAHHPVLPQTDFNGIQATLVAGSAFGLHAPVTVYSPLMGADLHLPAAPASSGAGKPDTATPGQQVEQDGSVAADIPLTPAFEHAVLCVAGSATIEGEPIAPGDMLYLGGSRSHVQLRMPPGARLLLLGGVPFNEPVLMWWNFVARTPQEILQASRDWNETDRFGTIAGSTLARIPAPDPTGMRMRAHQPGGSP